VARKWLVTPSVNVRPRSCGSTKRSALLSRADGGVCLLSSWVEPGGRALGRCVCDCGKAIVACSRSLVTGWLRSRPFPDERAGLIGDCEILIVDVAGSCLLPSKGLPQTESRSERSPVPFPVCEPMMNGNRWESRIMTKSGSGVVRLKE